MSHKEKYLLDAILSGNGGVYDLNSIDISKLYLNKMIPDFPEDIKAERHYLETTYQLNRRGFRSPDFMENPDLIIAGCSYSEGVGIKYEENTWGSRLGRALGLKYVNVSVPGSSVGSQIRILHSYIREFGKPTAIFALFPDFNRFEFPRNFNLMVNRSEKFEIYRNNHDSPWGNDYLSVKLWDPIGNMPKVSKAPHVAEKVLTEELTQFYSSQQINMFYEYCKEAGIKFAWSVWSDHHISLINHVKKMDQDAFPGYVDLNLYRRWHWDRENFVDLFHDRPSDLDDAIRINCHSDMSDAEDFHLGLDRIKVKRNGRVDIDAHWGFHRHIHFADEISKYVSEWFPEKTVDSKKINGRIDA